MVQWTTPFMIGITNGSLNSDDVLFHHYQVFTSSFPNQPLHACQDSNLKLLVLETSTLPIELHTHYFFMIPAITRNLRADFLFLQAFFVTFLIALLLMCWALAPVDLFLTWVRLYKEAEEVRRNNNKIL